MPGFLLIGNGVGLATPTLSSAAMSAVAIERGGMAAGAVNTARQLGFAFGIAALGSVFATRAEHILSDHGVPAADRAARALAGGQAPVLLRTAPDGARGALDSALHAASVGGVQWTFLISGIAGVLAGLAVLVLIRPRPAAAGETPDGESKAAPGTVPASVR